MTAREPPIAQTQVPTRSKLHELLAPEAFLWATGIEDTFVYDPHHSTGRILDEYELTHHYECWREDIELMAQLGVPAARYGIPWYKVETAPGRFDWSFPDKALRAMLERGIHPIVDLIHYSTPQWMEGAWLNPDFPKYMAEYATRFAERYKGEIWWYTPLNEPRITAHYCGRIGWWPPYRHGWRGLVELLIAICKGIIETDRALASVDPEIVKLHVDATDIYEVVDEAAREQAEFRQRLVLLPLDLVTGRMTPDNELYTWIKRHGGSDDDLSWFVENAVEPDVIGINLYPMFSRREVLKGRTGTRFRAKYGDRHFLTRTAEMYWQRYQRPLMISETASHGSVKRRSEWLQESIAAVQHLRTNGVPMVGYTWWPMFSLIGWGYRQGDLPFHKYIVNMGLWDLEGPDLERVRTRLVDEFAALVRDGARGVGRLRSGGRLV